MASQAATAAPVRLDPKTTETALRNSFFFWAATALLSILVIGFAPTLYLRAFYDAPPIPGYLHVHGAVLTAWFAWLVIQAWMIRTRRVATHRKLGLIGAVLGAAVVVVGPMATVGAVGRLRAAGFDWNTDMSALPEVGVEGVPMLVFAANVVWANFLSIAVFASLLVAAILLRRNSQAHKRLMLLASIAIVGPALARISRWPVFGGEDSPFVPVALLGLLVVMVAHDLVATRRLHKATLIGCGVIVLASIAQQMIAGSEFGRGVVRMLG